MPKNIIKIASLVFMAVPMIAAAAYNDVSLSVDTVITVNSKNLTVSGSAASIDSIVVDSNDFVATVSDGSSLIVKSADGYTMNVSGVGGNDYSQECVSTTNNTLTISISSGSTRSVKVSPTSTVCGVAVTKSGSRSGGGGGGGGSVAYVPTVSATPVPTVSVIPTPAQVQAVSFATDLSRGMENGDVTKLQLILAADSSVYPEGQVTGYFGPATERAVKRFQAKYGISQLGRVGPATRAKLNSLSITVAPIAPATSVAPQSASPATTGSAVFTANLRKGISGGDVARLQKLLNKNADTQVASEGPGSPGMETEMFGSLTEAAVGKFQVKYNVANPGDPGYGTVGPMTRAKLLEVFGNQ